MVLKQRRARARWLLGVITFGAAVSMSGSSGANPPAGVAPPPPAEPEDEPEPEADPGAPRAAVSSYLELVRGGHRDEAAAYLQLPEDARRPASELAERLKFVLERHGGVDVEALSPEAEGEPDDGLPPGVDRVAVIERRNGKEENVLIKRVVTKDGKRWMFTRDTVRKIDRWFAELDESWLLERMPAPLLLSGPLNLLWWQWIALSVVLLTAWALGTALGRLTIDLLERVAAKTPTELDDQLLARKRGPVTLLWSAAMCWALLPVLDLYPAAERTLEAVLRLLVFVSLFWAAARATDVVVARAAKSEWAKSNNASRSLLLLAARMLKLLVGGFAVVGLLAQLGYPVASLVAGVGLGGLVLALAAQKTVENLFGALSIAVDQPLREGDLVRIDEEVGRVETIGLRSTRIRSLHHTLISIPNGKLAEMRIESLAARHQMLLECTVGLMYDTSSEQLRRVLASFDEILRGHPDVVAESVLVHLVGYGESSLDIEVNASIKTTTLLAFSDVRQELLLAFMDAVAAAGARFWLPGQRLHWEEGGPPPPRTGEE